MDTLLPALIAVAIASMTDRPAWLAAILADRFGAPVRVFVAFAISDALLAAIGVAGALVVRPMLTPEAAKLMVALALGGAGIAMLGKAKAPDRLAGWKAGAGITALLGSFILGFGDRGQFIIFALALAGAYPVLAGVGGALGAVLALIPAIVLGEVAWRALPLRAFAAVGGALLLIVAVIDALGALRLI